MVRAYSTHGEGKYAYRVLAGKPESIRHVKRPTRGWEYSIKNVFREIGCCGMDWNNVAQDKDQCRVLLDMEMNLRLHKVLWNFFNTSDAVGFTREPNSIEFLVCEAIGTAATSGLLYQPRVIVKMIVEKQMECRLAGETDVLGENLPQRHFCPSNNPT
jgi:hypothetical protein